MARVAELRIHPVKSLRGVEVDRARFGPRGLEGDRRFALIDPAGGVFSAKWTPALLRLEARLEGDRLELRDPARAETRSVLAAESDVTETDAVIFARPLRVERYLDPALDEWLSERVGSRCHLARCADGFFDARPLSLQSRATQAVLEERTGMAQEPERFRPNLVVDGAPAHAEDDWRAFEHAGVRFRALGRIERCSMTTIHPETFEVGPEPLATLGAHGRPRLGAYFLPEGEGEFTVGDELRAR